MKKLFLVLLVVSCATLLNAQVKNPVDWKFESIKKGDNYEVVITAAVKKPWHIYSQNTGKSGPVPTSFSFSKNPLVTLDGKVEEEGKLEKVYDNAFKTEVLFYSNSVKFIQKIKVKAGVKTNISGTVEYMVCNDEQCLPPTKKPFTVTIK